MMKCFFKNCYSIDDDNVIKLYKFDNFDMPFLIQPTWPNNEEFGSREEAEEWAKIQVISMTDRSALRPKKYRGEPDRFGPSPEEFLAQKFRKQNKNML